MHKSEAATEKVVTTLRFIKKVYCKTGKQVGRAFFILLPRVYHRQQIIHLCALEEEEHEVSELRNNSLKLEPICLVNKKSPRFTSRSLLITKF